MKTTTLKIVLALAIGLVIGGIVMKLIQKPNNVNLSAIAERYIKVHGSPKEQLQQCELDFIVYDDVTECEP